MKVLKKGNPQKWGKKLRCTGKGNGGFGCNAQLLIEKEDLYLTYSSHYDGSNDVYTTFTCPECGVETDITDHTFAGDLPSKEEWLKRQEKKEGK